MPYAICLDFDGVLHSYDSPYTSVDVIPDPPVPGAQEFCEELIRRGFEVHVLSSRAASEDGRHAIRLWLAEHCFPRLESITHEKLPATIYVDDRGYRFENDFDAILRHVATPGKSREPWNKRGEESREERLNADLDALIARHYGAVESPRMEEFIGASAESFRRFLRDRQGGV